MFRTLCESTVHHPVCFIPLTLQVRQLEARVSELSTALSRREAQLKVLLGRPPAKLAPDPAPRSSATRRLSESGTVRPASGFSESADGNNRSSATTANRSGSGGGSGRRGSSGGSSEGRGIPPQPQAAASQPSTLPVAPPEVQCVDGVDDGETAPPDPHGALGAAEGSHFRPMVPSSEETDEEEEEQGGEGAEETGMGIRTSLPATPTRHTIRKAVDDRAPMAANGGGIASSSVTTTPNRPLAGSRSASLSSAKRLQAGLV